jgi:hypothetical protein
VVGTELRNRASESSWRRVFWYRVSSARRVLDRNGIRERRAHFVEDMAVKLAGHNLFQRTRKQARTEIDAIIRGEHDVRAIAMAANPVGTGERQDAPLDSQALLDLELQQQGRFNGGDPLN